jgi:hypothetical protein
MTVRFNMKWEGSEKGELGIRNSLDGREIEFIASFFGRIASL